MRKSLEKQLAIPLGRQTTLHSQSAKPAKTLASRWLALHSHSAKSPKDSDISRWLTPTKWPVMLKLLGFVAGLTLSATISAVGMGGINVTSGLGQQLKADIDLVSVSKTEKVSLVARLASPEVYKGAGLDYPHGNKFKFQIESRANGEPYLKVSSAQPVNDPFVVMLVELTWSSGRLLREYTFLLDPPGYIAELPVQAEVQPVAPAVESAAVPAADMPVEPVAAPEAPGFVEQGETLAASAPAAAPVEQVVPEVAAVPEDITAGGITVPNEEWLAVQRGDTLSKISAQYKPADVSLERMLVALYRANASEFDGKNMNRIRAGKVLRLPNPDEVDRVGQSEAVKEIRAQSADWNSYRQKLAGAASMSSQPQAAEQVASGKIASSVADKAPVAKESAREVLKLSKGEAPGDRAAAGAGGKSMSAQDKDNAAQEDAIATAKAGKEQQTRTAMLEKNLQDMQRLAQLKSAAAALAQQPPVAVAPPVAASAVTTAASGVKPAPVAKPKSKAPVKQEPSLVDQILAEPLYLAGAAGALVVLIGLGWLASRRKKKPAIDVLSQFNGDSGSRSGHIAAPSVPAPEPGHFTGMVAAKAATSEQSQEADPISEADLFLNFGRDVQAEEILKDALKDTPNNHRIHLKLLEIYANRRDLGSFATITRQLQDSGDEEAIQQALAMGRELDPNNPMYGGSGTKNKEDSGSTNTQAPVFNAMPRLVTGDAPPAKPVSVDFDLGAPSAESAPSPEQDFLADAEQTVTLLSPEIANKPARELDFDITSTHPPVSAAGGQTRSARPDLGDLIFDVTGSRPGAPVASEQAEVPLPKLDGMTFDITGSNPSQPETQPDAGKPAQADDGMMEFTLDFPVENKAGESVATAQPAEVGLAGISLNFDAAATPAAKTSENAAPASENKDEHWQEVATKLDLAKAYQEMGDASGAREIIEEVMREGDAGQREAAQSLLAQLG